MGKAIRESSFFNGWDTVPNGECFFVNREKGLFLSVYVDDIKLAGKTENIEPSWTILMKDVDLGDQHHFLTTYVWGCTQRECKISNCFVANYRDMVCSNPGFLLEPS